MGWLLAGWLAQDGGTAVRRYVRREGGWVASRRENRGWLWPQYRKEQTLSASHAFGGGAEKHPEPPYASVCTQNSVPSPNPHS